MKNQILNIKYLEAEESLKNLEKFWECMEKSKDYFSFGMWDWKGMLKEYFKLNCIQ